MKGLLMKKCVFLGLGLLSSAALAMETRVEQSPAVFFYQAVKNDQIEVARRYINRKDVSEIQVAIAVCEALHFNQELSPEKVATLLFLIEQPIDLTYATFGKTILQELKEKEKGLAYTIANWGEFNLTDVNHSIYVAPVYSFTKEMASRELDAIKRLIEAVEKKASTK